MTQNSNYRKYVLLGGGSYIEAQDGYTILEEIINNIRTASYHGDGSFANEISILGILWRGVGINAAIRTVIDTVSIHVGGNGELLKSKEQFKEALFERGVRKFRVESQDVKSWLIYSSYIPVIIRFLQIEAIRVRKELFDILYKEYES